MSKLLPSCQKLIENIVEPKIKHKNNQFSDLQKIALMSTYFLDEKIEYIPGKMVRFSEKNTSAYYKFTYIESGIGDIRN
ncbi:hypothetical protein [Arsenophonus endosymbiont of Bemisia tabaci]|uniref:hypothetical protein n=1 Tax=Arsenophonus endosymbiont of Bemisia tabaci TaxID=536059 RepID=UPI0015F571A3|nr:hypothetical protein [Arsenophonus endosymbiont of Bemisia tabaci]CAA2930002.1 hypothetical protein ARSQ2_01115 [Arsenophonus endosymbiont of Bemisia tabaci Q2]